MSSNAQLRNLPSYTVTYDFWTSPSDVVELMPKGHKNLGPPSVNENTSTKHVRKILGFLDYSRGHIPNLAGRTFHLGN